MPTRLTGFFATLDLEQIPPEDIARWLKPNPGLDFVENYLANKLLYPQTVAYSQGDLAIELAILREVVRRHPENYQAGGKIFIPKNLEQGIGAILDLTLALVDVLKPSGVVEVLVDKKPVGSVIRPELTPKGLFSLSIEGKEYKFKSGNLTAVVCPTARCHINFNGTDVKLSGKNELVFETAGGALGLLVDGRIF